MNEIIYCSRCVTPNTRPRISFNQEGVCSACTYADYKNTVDWAGKLEELKQLIHSTDNKNSTYDCIVPASGGKDSLLQVHYAKNILHLNPLVVTFMPAIPSQVSSINIRNMLETVGVDHVSITPNPHVHRKLCRTMFEMHGNPFLPWIMGIFSGVTQVSVEKQIPIILYGENGEAEYGGETRTEASKSLSDSGIELRVKSDRFNWKNPCNWTEYGFNEREIAPYILPPEDSGFNVNRVFLGDYIPWNNNRNYFSALNVVGGFSTLPNRTVGTYTFGSSIDDEMDELYLWMLWVKFGFCRASKSASPDVREGRLTRSGAVELVRLYDGEFPWHIFERLLSYMEITEQIFWSIIRRFIGDDVNLNLEQQAIIGSGIPVELVTQKVAPWEKLSPKKWRHRGTIHGEERILEIPVPKVTSLHKVLNVGPL